MIDGFPSNACVFALCFILFVVAATAMAEFEAYMHDRKNRKIP